MAFARAWLHAAVTLDERGIVKERRAEGFMLLQCVGVTSSMTNPKAREPRRKIVGHKSVVHVDIIGTWCARVKTVRGTIERENKDVIEP